MLDVLTYSMLLYRHNNPQLPSTSSITSGHTHTNELQDITIKSTKLDHPHHHHTIHVSPSGRHVCIHYPYTYTYAIYTSDGDMVHTNNASEFAFVGMGDGNGDVYVMKNPAHHIGQEVKRKASVFGFGNNSNKSAHKVFRFSSVSIKQVWCRVYGVGCMMYSELNITFAYVFISI
ncbi:hypothetical protein EON65_16815 [archaeon]|nr:MAG: hypothetical protein EON65_16815 [archaeon]